MYLAFAPALLATTSPLPMPVMALQASEIPQAVSPSESVAEQPDAVPPADPLAEDAAPQEPGEDDIIRVEGTVLDTPGDPLENINAQTYELTQQVDQAIVGPVAAVYEEDLPKPIRNGMRNFLRNLLEPVNFLNFILQLKPGKAVETLGRFAINTTAGFGGLFDVAATEPFNLPYRRNGLANTLGYYGVGPGPFLVLPLVGATTLRDLVGSTIDQAVVPFAVGAPLNTPYYAIPAYTVNSLQYRMEVDERLAAIRDSDDPYAAMRESYLCLREADIAELRNRPAPRDCSIEALTAEPEDLDADGDYAEDATIDYAPVLDEAPAPAVPVAPPAPAEPVFESIPVIQGQSAQ